MTPAPPPALAGVRVLDLTHAWAGPFATQLLADYGAEVIKIESCERPDMVRFSTLPAASPPDAYNRSGFFHYLNRNKLGLTLDLKHPQGKHLFTRLATQSDVVVENFSARVMASLGLDYPVLSAANPRLIMISMPGFGTEGPYRDFVAFGEMIEPFAGLSELTGYPDRGPLRLAVAYPDPVAGWHAALATLLALRQRRLTGVGRHIRVPHREPITRMIGEAVLDYTVNGRTQHRSGNRHRAWAPHGCFPCRGLERWVALAVRTDAEWTALCQILEAPEWTDDARFANSLGRWKQALVLERLVSEKSVRWEAPALAARLSAAGIPAGEVHTNQDLLCDLHLRERQAFWMITQELTGTHPYPAPSARLSGTPAQLARPAPHLGEHNGAILAGLLGLSSAEIFELETQGVIGTVPR